MTLVGNTNQRTIGVGVRSEDCGHQGIQLRDIDTLCLGNRSSEKRKKTFGRFQKTPAIRLGKAGLRSVTSAGPRRGGLLALSTIRVLDPGNQGRIAGCR